MSDGLNDKLNQINLYPSAFEQKAQGNLDFTTKSVTLKNPTGIAELTVADAGEILAAIGSNPSMLPDKTLAFDLAVQYPGTSNREMTISGAATYDKKSGGWTFGDPNKPSCVVNFERAAKGGISMTMPNPEACAPGMELTSDKYTPVAPPVVNPARKF